MLLRAEQKFTNWQVFVGLTNGNSEADWMLTVVRSGMAAGSDFNETVTCQR